MPTAPPPPAAEAVACRWSKCASSRKSPPPTNQQIFQSRRIESLALATEQQTQLTVRPGRSGASVAEIVATEMWADVHKHWQIDTDGYQWVAIMSPLL